MQGLTNVKIVNAGEEKSTKTGEEELRTDTNEHETQKLKRVKSRGCDGKADSQSIPQSGDALQRRRFVFMVHFAA
jgi:hypothetical protein